MKILLIGEDGQVGSELRRQLPALGRVAGCDFPAVDLSDAASVRAAVRASAPEVIVNAAAYTGVDDAEAQAEQAMRINGLGPAVLAEEANRAGALLVHYSTDYVFDGVNPLPYTEADVPNPLNAYGRSKLEADKRIVASGCRHLILRTSWVYGSSGRNFLLTMLRLGQKGRPLKVVDDQHGAPTSSSMLASATVAGIRAVLRDHTLSGLYHATAAGKTTWYRFACEIFRALGMNVHVTPIRSDEYRAAARRPANSVLDNTKLNQRLDIRMPSWQAGLAEVIDRLR